MPSKTEMSHHFDFIEAQAVAVYLLSLPVILIVPPFTP